MQTATRKSVPLDPSLEELVSALCQPGSSERLALESIIGDLPENLSEAQILHRLLTLGAQGVREAQLYAGYLEIAADQDEEDRQYREWSKARRNQRLGID